MLKLMAMHHSTVQRLLRAMQYAINWYLELMEEKRLTGILSLWRKGLRTAMARE